MLLSRKSHRPQQHPTRLMNRPLYSLRQQRCQLRLLFRSYTIQSLLIIQSLNRTPNQHPCCTQNRHSKHGMKMHKPLRPKGLKSQHRLLRPCSQPSTYER